MELSRRKLLKTAALAPAVQTCILQCAMSQEGVPLNAVAGMDRVVVLPGRTWLRGWAGYGQPPRPGRDKRAAAGVSASPPPVKWTRESGPAEVKFSDAQSLQTTAIFTSPGEYLLRLSATDGRSTSSSTLRVLVETPPPAQQLGAVYGGKFRVDSPFWGARSKALIVNWIPHCIHQINRTDLTTGEGGIDNFIEAGRKLRGESHGVHKGYVFSNAWVHQTVEAMSIALMIDPQGDPDMLKAHKKFRETLEDWIPKILAAQESDGYLQTAFTLPRAGRNGTVVDTSSYGHWDPKHRADHEGYVAGYFIEAAINHYMMTGRRDGRLYNAAKKLADCWDNNLGPAPKKAWFDGHQEMEQALVRFGRFVNEVEGAGKGDRYINLAKFLLDCREGGSEYDQSHVPVVQQYEAVGHAVRAVYTYSAMADVAVETHDPDYQSAVKSLWDNLVNRKYYVTGGVGSGETSEGFGPDYSLRNNAYNEACSTCGEIFFQWKMNLAYHDARYVDLYEESMYNALLGSMDLEGRHFYYDNPLDADVPRYAWHVCPCCVGNIPRTLLMFPTWMYAKSSDGLYVNLYTGSMATVPGAGGTDIEVVQRTNYPWSGKVSITVNPKVSKRFTVRLRVPGRDVSTLYRSTPQVSGLVSLAVNGAAVKPALDKGYAVVTRTWKAGDRIELELPMKPQRIRGSEKIEATRGKVALRYGPLIYNIEQADQDIRKSLASDAPLKAEWRPDLLGGVMVITSRFSDGSPLLAIPNFARLNREAGLPLPPRESRKGAVPRSIVWIREA